MKTFGQIVIGLLAIVLLVAASFFIRSCSIAQKHATDSMENAVISYDEYQNIYATCQQINDDLGVIKATPETDKQFTDFSKAQRINTLKMNLNRWINEYNAKSKHIDKKLWKSNDLPQELTQAQFSNY